MLGGCTLGLLDLVIEFDIYSRRIPHLQLWRPLCVLPQQFLIRDLLRIFDMFHRHGVYSCWIAEL